MNFKTIVFLSLDCLFILIGCTKDSTLDSGIIIEEKEYRFSGSSSRATGYNDSNKIIETDSTIYIAWLGNDNKGFKIQITKYDKLEKKFTQTKTISYNVDDNHGGPAMVMDSEGFIHIVYGPHSSSMKYSKSIKPFDINDWEEEIEFGKNLTYPSLVITSTNSLILVARQSNWGSQWSLLLFKKTNNSDWTDGEVIVKANYEEWKAKGYSFNNVSTNGYTRYSKSLAIDKSDNIHMSFKVAEYLPDQIESDSEYENGMGFYMIGYLYSKDEGKTWYSVGKPLNLPVSVADAEIISGSPDPSLSKAVYDISNIALDEFGDPLVAYSASNEESVEFFLSRRKDSEWVSIKFNEYLNQNDVLMISPSSVSCNSKGEVFIAATTIAKSEYCKCLKTWANQSNQVSLLKYSDGFLEEIYNSKELATSPNWLPLLDYHYKGVENPVLLFTSGSSGMSNSSIENNAMYAYIKR